MVKPRIAFLYRPDNPYLCGKRSNINFEKFYLNTLKNLEDVDIDYYGTKDEFDCKDIAGKYDVYLFFDVEEWGISPKLKNVESLRGIKICSIGDAHGANKFSKAYQATKKELVSRFGIDYCYYQHTEDYFYKFYPKSVKYWCLPLGVDTKLYHSVKPFKERRKDKVLLSGSVCLPYYPIRVKIKDYPNVFYQKPGSYQGFDLYNPGKYDKNGFKELLENWRFSVASAYSIVMKYFEIPASGCLSLSYVDNGASIIGFKDNENSIFVNENNVEEKIKEVLSTSDDPKWEAIAENGRIFILETYSYEKCAKRLMNKIKEIL
jgi:hypothetical protein